MIDKQRRDYIPQNAAQFAVFLRILLEYVNAHKAAWGHIPQAVIDNMWVLHDDFAAAFEITSGQHTPAQTLDRNEKQAAATKGVRGFTNQYLRFAPVTNVDRLEMGIPNHDTVRTNHIEVNELVEFLVNPGTIRQVLVDFWIKGADHKAKPRDYDGAVILWEVLDTPPTEYSELTHHAMASRTPFKLYFEENERRKQVYVALAWQNARGIRGAWSEIKSVYIT